MEKYSPYLVVIPARFKSSRLPGKPLIKINGVPMLQRTYEQCLKVCAPVDIVVATDDVRIQKFCITKNINVVMTDESCLTGTDRVNEVARSLKKRYYINVQGDEPIFNPDDLKYLIEYCERNSIAVVNGYTRILDLNDFNSVNIPKVVFNDHGDLVYMSRAGIPASKSGTMHESYRQVCLYAFSRDALNKFATHRFKTRLESIEDIEILRFLELGVPVKMLEMSSQSISVDVSEDILKVERYLNEN